MWTENLELILSFMYWWLGEVKDFGVIYLVDLVDLAEENGFQLNPQTIVMDLK